MTNLYMFEIRLNDDTVLSLVVPGDRNSVFMTAEILSRSDMVKEFKVSFGAQTVLIPEHWGFGTISKWVIHFSWGRYEHTA